MDIFEILRKVDKQRHKADKVKVLKENETWARWIAENGGVNRQQLANEAGFDIADMQKIAGGFGKPVFRKTGGYSPDLLAERLREVGYDAMDMNDAIDLLDSIIRNPKMLKDPTAQVEIDNINMHINWKLKSKVGPDHRLAQN